MLILSEQALISTSAHAINITKGSTQLICLVKTLDLIPDGELTDENLAGLRLSENITNDLNNVFSSG